MALHKRGMTVGMGKNEAGINDDRDMLQEMRLALTVHRAKTKDVMAVMIEGRTVYTDGRFPLINRDTVLARIAEALAKPRDEDERERHWLHAQVFPVVEDFHDGYLEASVDRPPFYKASSAT